MLAWQKLFIDHPVIAALLADEAFATNTYLVGGVLRDIMLGKETFAEIDLTSMQDLAVIKESLAVLPGVSEIKVYPKFGTMSVLCAGIPIPRVDVVRSRSELYPTPGSLPVVQPAMQLIQDLERRDFTINALALPLKVLQSDNWQASLIDLCNGLADIKAGQIKVLHPKSFSDDPTRMLRAARYAGRFGFSLEKNTEAFFIDAVTNGFPRTISLERIVHELDLICREPQAAQGLQLLATHRFFDACNCSPLNDLMAEILQEIPDPFHTQGIFWALRVYWLYLTPEDERVTVASKLQLTKKLALRLGQLPKTGALSSTLAEIISEKRVAKNPQHQ